MGLISDTSDIGGAIRDEPNSGIPNTLAAWGAEGPGTPAGTGNRDAVEPSLRDPRRTPHTCFRY